MVRYKCYKCKIKYVILVIFIQCVCLNVFKYEKYQVFVYCNIYFIYLLFILFLNQVSFKLSFVSMKNIDFIGYLKSNLCI